MPALILATLICFFPGYCIDKEAIAKQYQIYILMSMQDGVLNFAGVQEFPCAREEQASYFPRPRLRSQTTMSMTAA
jgi:hypothetical protein